MSTQTSDNNKRMAKNTLLYSAWSVYHVWLLTFAQEMLGNLLYSRLKNSFRNNNNIIR